MNNKYTVFLILAILVIAFLWNKNEHLDSNVDNVIAKGTITTGSAGNQFQLIQSLQDGKNNILSILPLKPDGTPNWDNNIVVGGGGNKNIWTNKNITSTGTINATGNISGGGLISEKDAWIKGLLAVNGNVNVGGTITANKIISKDGSSSGALSNEAIQSIASVYNKDNLTATNINATGTITNGSTTLSGTTLKDTGRFHIASGELLYLLPKDGVIIGKEWGGNGNLQVQGIITTPGNITGGGLISEKDAWIKGVLAVGGQLNAAGGFKTPLDMTRVDAKMMNVWNDTGYDDSFCPDGYYMYGVTKATHQKGATFNPACRKLPGA